MSRNRYPLRPRPLFTNAVPKAVENPKIKWRILPILWTAMKRGAMTLGFVVMFSVFISVMMFGSLMQQAEAPLPGQMALVLEFKDNLWEIPPEASFTNPFNQDDMTLRHYIAAIESAKTDDRVKGIIARLRDGSFSTAQIEELRAAIEDFKTSGKFTRIYSTSFGDGGGGLGRYYLASVFDELWMQPMGLVMISGVNAEQPFLRGVLDKMGVKPEFFQRKEYKTAYESLTNETMSDANREEITALVNDIKNTLVPVIAKDRGMEPEQFLKLVEQGLFTADEALEAGLIDHMDYADVMIEEATALVTGDPLSEDLPMVAMQSYIHDVGVKINEDGQLDKNAKAGKKAGGVALVYVVGAIVTRNDGGASMAASDDIAPAILDAVADPDIKAIVLRVDSPGGSPAASEAILRALDKAQEQGKYVVVSMGATAASGGYWVAAHADRIFVSPTTITGSIGVVGGKFSLEETWKKLGVNWETVQWGDNADIWSINKPFDAQGAARMNAMLDNVYKNFIQRVAEGRDMTPQQIDLIAKGRVWSGKRAIDVGLADEMGGLLEAIDYAATLNGGAGRSDVFVQIFPKPKTPLEQIVELLSGESGSPFAAPGFQSAVLREFEPLIEAAIVTRDSNGISVYEPLRVR